MRVMNHPKGEDWVPYLYGEIKPDLRRQLKEHLEGCAECREELQNWKSSLHRLDAWKLPRTSARLDAIMPFMKWAAAALLVLGLGFGFGRLTARQSDLAKLRSQIEPGLRREFTEMLRREIDKSSAMTLAQAQRQAEEVAAAYYALLKKDLDTVAINTDVSLQQAQRELMQVADFKQPAERQSKEQ
jgi:anti-sigma factor RsiW